MSRSNPHRSPIAERLHRESNPDGGPSPPRHRTLRRRLAIRIASLIRWIHIYLSLFGLASVLFFSVTGLTLNHPSWLFGGRERRSDASGVMNRAWLRLPGAPTEP